MTAIKHFNYSKLASVTNKWRNSMLCSVKFVTLVDWFFFNYSLVDLTHYREWNKRSIRRWKDVLFHNYNWTFWLNIVWSFTHVPFLWLLLRCDRRQLVGKYLLLFCQYVYVRQTDIYYADITLYVAVCLSRKAEVQPLRNLVRLEMVPAINKASFSSTLVVTL